MMTTTCTGPHQRLVYSVEHACEQLDISKTVLYELIAAGDIPVIHYADGRRRVGITHQALVAFVASREGRPSVTEPQNLAVDPLAAARRWSS